MLAWGMSRQKNAWKAIAMVQASRDTVQYGAEADILFCT